MAIIKMIIAYILCSIQILFPLNVLFKINEESYFTKWSENDTFDKADYIEMEKPEGEDFVILNLADIQVGDENLYGDDGIYSEQLIRQLVEDHDPDLITLTGDNAWGALSYLKHIELMDSLGIPWAPVMGNHDGEGCPSEFWAAYELSEAENCLFEFGPEGMGYGNYIINITENGKIIHTLFMMDTHGSDMFTLEDGTEVDGYDNLWDNQQDWYKWAVKGIEKLEGKKVESSVLMHIPLQEYTDAWNESSVPEKNFEFGKIDPEKASTSEGLKGEDVCSSPINNGFFDLCKELGSTKTILVGHDHCNDYSVLYKGIRLAYGVKSGFGSYWREDMIGATTININSEGNAELKQNYYDIEEHGYDVKP